MIPPSGFRPASSNPSLRFACKECGTPLILPDASATVSGPCPKCAAWIDSGPPMGAKPPADRPQIHVAEPGSRSPGRSRNVIGGRGRVRADGYLDHEYNDRRELYGTLRFLAVALAILAVILFVTLYLREWMSE